MPSFLFVLKTALSKVAPAADAGIKPQTQNQKGFEKFLLAITTFLCYNIYI